MDLNLYITAFMGFASALACIVGVLKAFDYLKTKNPTIQLRKEVDELTKRVDRLEGDIGLRKEETEELVESINLLGLAMSSMINHWIDGNGIEEMKKEREKLNAFFYRRDSH